MRKYEAALAPFIKSLPVMPQLASSVAACHALYWYLKMAIRQGRVSRLRSSSPVMLADT